MTYQDTAMKDRVQRRSFKMLTKNSSNTASPAAGHYQSAFILPQYSGLSELPFSNNSLHPSKTVQQTKDKLQEITVMMRQSALATPTQQLQQQQQLFSQQLPTSTPKHSGGYLNSTSTLQVPVSSNSPSTDGGLLKNGNTMTWLKKRYLESGNRKYFGDSEGVQQSAFIKALFDNITRHLNTPNLIHISDFSRLLISFELPMTFATLMRIFAIVDADRDNALDLEEFSDFILSDSANRLYMEQFKGSQQSKSFANLAYRPTSLSTLCIFVSFRINHDFLIEFLYDPNFQVKDKSQGLAKMLELIKLQGETRIKSDVDKRLIRQLKVDHAKNEQDGIEESIGAQIEEDSPTQMKFASIQISDDEEDGEEYGQAEEGHGHEFGKRHNKKSMKKSQSTLKLPKILTKTGSQPLIDRNPQGKRRSLLEKEIEEIIGKANQLGQANAASTFEQGRDVLKSLRVNALESGFVKKEQPKHKRMEFDLNRSSLNMSTASLSMVRGSGGRSEVNNNTMNRLSGFVDQNTNTTVTSTTLGMRGGGAADKGSRYSKHMGHLMEITLQEAGRSKQAVLARKILGLEDSDVIKQARKQMKAQKQTDKSKITEFAFMSSGQQVENKRKKDATAVASSGGGGGEISITDGGTTSVLDKYQAFFPID